MTPQAHESERERNEMGERDFSAKVGKSAFPFASIVHKTTHFTTSQRLILIASMGTSVYNAQRPGILPHHRAHVLYLA